MPTVHLIHGYLGAGKTTFAKELAEDGSLFIADNTFDVLKVRFEPVQPDELHLLIDTEQTLPEDCQNLKGAP